MTRSASQTGAKLWYGAAMRHVGLLGVGLAIASTISLLEPATASPLEDPTIGGSTFTGVTAPHATSIVISPAALAMSGRGLHVYAQLGGRLSMLSIDRQQIDPNTLEETDGPSVSENILMPGGMLALYGQVADRGSAGIAVGLPMMERFAKSDELAYHSGGGHFFQAQLSVAGTLRLGSRFHIGLGVSLAYSRFALRLARDTAMDAGSAGIASDCNGAPCGFENDAARQDFDITASTQGVSGFFSIPGNIGAVLGALYEIRPEWWRVAVSVVAPPGTFTALPLRGRAIVRDAPRDGGAERRGVAEVPIRVPESIRIGARGPLTEELELHFSGRWQNTSRHRELDIRMFGGDLEDSTAPEWYPRFRGFSRHGPAPGRRREAPGLSSSLRRTAPSRLGCRQGLAPDTDPGRGLECHGVRRRPGACRRTLRIGRHLRPFLVSREDHLAERVRPARRARLCR